MANTLESNKLIIANQELIRQSKEKDKLVVELAIANKELAFQQKEKELLEEELIIAKKELVLQNEQNKKQSTELIASNQKLKNSQKKVIKGKELYSFISQINQTIVHVKDEDSLFGEACRIAMELENFKMAWIGKFEDGVNKKITLVQQSGMSANDVDLFSNTLYQDNNSIQDSVLHTGKYYISNDIPNNFEMKNQKEFMALLGLYSCMILPIKILNEVVGTFNLYATEINFFNQEEIALLIEVAGDISFALDMFENKRIHKAMVELVEKNEKRFRALIEHSVDMKTLADEEGKILYCSPSIKKILGYSEEEFLSKPEQVFIYHEDIAAYVKNRRKVLKTNGDFVYYQIRLLHKNGSLVWCEGTITNLLEEPEVQAIVSNFRDISQKKKTEQQQEFDKNNLYALINNTKDLMWSVDRDFNLITSNESFDEMVKVISDNIITKGANVLSASFNPEQRRRYKKNYERAFAGETFTEVEYMNSPIEIWSEISFYPILNGEDIIGTACHSHDITERKIAETLLRKSEAFNLGVFNSLSAHIAVIDNLGNIVAINDAWKQFGIENGETTLQRIGIGSNYFEVCKKSAESGNKVASDTLNGIMDVLQVKQYDFYIEYPCHSPYEQRWFSMRAKRFEGDEDMVVVAHVNITERKLAQNKLIVASNELQRALSDITKIMDSSLDVICVVNAEGVFLNVSAASEVVWGYRPEELIGKSVFDFIYPEDHERTRNMAISVMQGISSTNFENRYLRKDGTVVPISWSVQWDEKDKVRYGIARDVTEKKRLEKAFEIERQQFFDLFSEAPSSMGVLSGSGHTFEMANPLYLKLIGKKDIIGKSVKDVLPEVMEQGFIDILDRVYQTGKTFSANEMLIKLDINNNGKPVDRYLNFLYQPHIGSEGKTDGILFFAVDVSEQVLSRKKIEESESRLKEAQKIGHLGDWQIDLATNKNNWSDEFYRIFGIKRDETNPSEEVFLSFIHPDDIINAQNKMAEASTVLKPSSFDFRFIREDGVERFGYTEWKFEFDKNNKPIFLHGIMQDITEHKLTEEKIKQSESRFREIFESSPIPIVILDMATRTFSKFNDKALKLFKYPADKFGKMGPAGISPEFQSNGNPSKEKAIEFGMSALNGAKPVFEWLFKDSEGTDIICEVQIAALIDINGPQIIGSFVDITERKRSEKALQLTQFAFDNASDAIFWMSSDARIVNVNEAAHVSLGYTQEELLSLSVPDIDPDFNMDVWSAFFPELREKQSISIETIQLRKDGSLFPVEIIANYIKFGDKEFSCAFVRDITERKKVEQNLEQQNKELQKTNTELDRFVYSTSHDLRAPLASLLGLIDITTDDVDPANELLIEYMGMMKQSVLKLDNFIGDILKYSRNARTELEKGDIVFDDMIQEVLEKHKFMEMASEFELKIDVNQKAAFSSDKRRINVILNNLISNAIKYKDATKEKSFVHISVQSDKKNATIIIEDNGIGIAEKDKKKIFEMFYRGTNQSTGSGLGLYIVQETIDKLGANIMLESEKSVGSKFTITIFNLLDNENENNITN